MQTGRYLKGAYKNAPLFIALFSVVAVLHLECKSLAPAEWKLAYTTLFPLFWIGMAIWSISRRDNASVGQAVLFVVLACVALPGFVLLVPGIKAVSFLPTLKLVYEAFAVVLFAFFAVHCLLQRGMWLFVLFFVGGAIYGMVLENGGIQMGFFSENGYRVYLRPFLPGPLVVALGWCTVFYTVVFLTECITTNATAVWKRTALAVIIALSIDLQVDPVATLAGWWEWHPSLPAFHHGVPLINYISWVCAMLPFAWHYFSMANRGVSERTRATRTLIGVPIYLAVGAAMVLSVTAVLCGPGSSTMELFVTAISNALRGV